MRPNRSISPYVLYVWQSWLVVYRKKVNGYLQSIMDQRLLMIVNPTWNWYHYGWKNILLSVLLGHNARLLIFQSDVLHVCCVHILFWMNILHRETGYIHYFGKKGYILLCKNMNILIRLQSSMEYFFPKISSKYPFNLWGDTCILLKLASSTHIAVYTFF